MTPRFDASARIALVVAALTLVASGVGFRVAVGMLNIHLHKEAVPLRGPLARIPVKLGPWERRGADGVLSAEIRDALGTEQYLDRNYLLDDGVAPVLMSLHIAYYTGMIDTVPHVPERCWGAGGMTMTRETFRLPLSVDMTGWRETDLINRASEEPYRAVEFVDPISQRIEAVHMPIGDFALRVTEFQIPGQPDLRYIGGYLFVANGRLTSSALGVRSLAFQATDRHAYYAKVQFSSSASAHDPNRFDTFAQHASDLLSRLLPHLMRQLPDWSEVERGGAEPPSASGDGVDGRAGARNDFDSAHS